MATNKKKVTYQLPVVIEQDEDGYFVASCPSIQGCHTQGDTLEEAITNIREAMGLCLEVMKDQGKEVPRSKPISLTSLEVTI